jgi:uncharacterized membrane protein YfcA
VLGNLRLPAVLLLSSSAAAGGGANIAISGVAAAAAGAQHVRAGRINWRLVAWMAPPSAVGAVVGGYLAGVVPQRALLLAIGAVLLYSGVDLLRGRSSPGGDPAGTGVDVRAAVFAGLVIGLLGGFVGLILGSLRMPALLRLVGERASRAVGTNLVVGICVGVAGLSGHLPTASPQWSLVLIGSLASVPGAVVGARFTGRLSEEHLVRAIGVVLLVAGVAAGVQAIF